MILSGTLTLSPADHAAATSALRTRLTDLEEHRLRAARSVEHVLGSWRGEAADTFRGRWEEWDRGALTVIDQLRGAIGALDLARRDVLAANDVAADSSARLGGRLG